MHTELAEGTIIDQRYKILRLLGQGRSGTVYSARDSQLARNVAVKILNRALLQDSAFATRFVREARVLASIDHKNIMRCFDMVLESAVGAYLVSELVNGKNLYDLVKQQGRLNLDDALEIVIQTLDGAEELRLKQLVHRDIKPSNIMIDWSDSAKLAKIIDFGLVGFGTMMGEQGDLKITKPDMLLGTPPYMSPEQIRGQELDHRSDLFSIGCMLYKLITGETPVSADTPFETMVQQLTRNPKPLSNFVNGLPDGIEEVVSRALTKEREQRFQTAAQFSEALTEIKGRINLKAVDQTICRICGRPRKSKISNASITGWIFSCSCQVNASGDLPPICVDCGKTIAHTSTGTLTQWLFKSNHCSCESPRLQTPQLSTPPVSSSSDSTGTTEPEEGTPAITPGKNEKQLSLARFALIGSVLLVVVALPCLPLLIPSEQPEPPKTTIKLDSTKADAVGMFMDKFERIPLHIIVDKNGLWKTQGLELNNADLVKVKEQIEAFAPMKAARRDKKVLRGRLKLNKCLLNGNGGLEALKDLNLVSLDLSNTYIDDSAIETLSTFPILQELSIRKIDNLSERVGEQLAKLKQLRTLRISGRGITHNTIADLYKMENLDEFEIGEMTITAEDVRNLKKCTRLTTLGFEQCKIEPDAYAQLATMKTLAELRMIEINISVREISGLASLKRLPTLTFILCPGLTDAMVGSLRNRLPKTQVVNHNTTLSSTN